MLFNNSDNNGIDLDEKAIKVWIAMNPPNPEIWVYTQDNQAVNGYDGMAAAIMRPLHPRWDIVRRDLKK